MATSYLVSTALMGLVGFAILGWVARSRGWYDYTPSAGGWVPTGAVQRRDELWDDPAVLGLGFALLVVGFVGLTFAYISAPAAQRATMGLSVALAGGIALVSYLLFGVYSSAKRRGHPSSLAAAESATVAATLFLVAIVAQLVA
ncbi:hypothetical protein [Haloarcula litorea]|uniref:hypothetical protein n=1 Tax=Haloarcula litorea TaxID=3032579 RepID=UPI0023E75659|nr:hypothetical protein [Halomicroarcula sp. GDY20]